MKEKWDAFMGRFGFAVTMAICLLVVGISGYFLLFDREESAQQEKPAPVSGDLSTPVTEISVPEHPAESGMQPIPEVLSPEPDIPASAPMPEIAVDDTPVIAEAPQLIVPPLKGDVLAVFSMDTLVYSETLGDWRTHDGVDISAKPGTTVQAASAGTVRTVTDDVLMGTTVVIGHKDGYETTYANLQASPTVKAGDTVTAGQVIGAVGTTAAAESSRSPHLHFSVTQDGIPVDPNEYLNR
ncbi:MAG: M23 family metallopeptidase [Oscillibacter sp.]|nr:M23 family metallopeptidase [Oscillibacter sp.]